MAASKTEEASTVGVLDRFSEPLAWPTFGAFLLWAIVAVLFAIELGQVYFVNWHASCIGFTIALGIVWLLWTVLIIYDQAGGVNCSDATEEKQTTNKLRSASDTGLLWGAYILNSFFTIAFVIFVWLRLTRIDGAVDEDFVLTTAEDVYGQLSVFGFTEDVLLKLVLAINDILQIESAYLVSTGVYSSFLALMAFFAVTAPHDEKNRVRKNK